MSLKDYKICLVSSCGGHLTEIRALRSVYEQYSFFYVINDRIELPEDMKNCTHFIRHSERDFLFFMNIWEAWGILSKEKPQLILTSGAGPAVPFALVAKLLRIPVVFIEISAQVITPSLTGRIMYYLADRFFYQWRSLETFFPKGIYGGLLF